MGIVGCGWVARNFHIPNYMKNPKSEIAALCDSNESVLKEIKDKFGVKHTFTDYQELLDSNIVDAISVCTPTRQHYEVVAYAIKCGLHILCEKPLVATMEEADRIVESVGRSGKKFMVGFNYRFLPNHRKAREYLRSGKIGKPIFIRGELLAAGPYRSETPKDSIKSETEKRIGAFFDLGAHMADLFIWMVGQPEKVNAFFSTYREGVTVDDCSTVLIRFESGVLGAMITSWVNHPDYIAMADSRVVEIVGDKGKIESDFFGPSLYLYSKNSLSSKLRGKIRVTPVKFNPNIPNEALNWSYQQEIESFLDSIIKDKEPPVTAKQAREVLKLVLAAYKANQESMN